MNAVLPPLLLALLATLTPLAGAAAEPPVTGAEPVLRDFDNADYTLAFDVLVANGRLEEAFQVAQRAVRAVPRDRLWRRRLAQVAEWTGRTDVAAQQWQTLFAQGDRSDETLGGLLRLAPALDDPTAVLEAWTFMADRQTLTDAQWEEVYWLFENAGEPARGARFFEERYRRDPRPLLLVYAARLAANAGDETRAQRLYRERLALAPFSLEVLLQAVLGHLNANQWDEAYALMQRHAERVGPDATDYWRLLGQIAWDLGHYEAAAQAYRRTALAPGGTETDWIRLVFLVRQQHPQAAAELALQSFQRYGNTEQLVQAILLYNETGDSARLGRLLRSLDGERLARAEQNVQFLLLRAQYHQTRLQPDAAWQDLRRAYQLDPRGEAVAQALIWFLIAEQRSTELAAALQRYRTQAQRDPDFWPAYAAGFQALDQPREALAWYRRAIAHSPQDALLLLGYADALEQWGRTGMADRVRRHAWQLLQDQRPRQPEDLRALQARPALQAWARLALRNQSGDPGQQLARTLAAQLRASTGEPALQNQLDTLLLGWAALKDQHPQARSWLYTRYARQMQAAAPAWSDVLQAQEAGDSARLHALLHQRARPLPRATRQALAETLGQMPLALQTAVEGMAQPAAAPAMHERLRQLVPQHAHYLQLRAVREDIDVLQRHGLQFEARWVASPTLHVVGGWARLQQSADGTDLQALVPGTDRLDRLELRHLGAQRETRVTVLQHDARERTSGLRLWQRAQASARLGYEIGLDYRNESQLSIPMRAAGYEHSLYASATYALDTRSYLRATPRWSRYYTQYHDALGSARMLELEAGYRLRRAYPDWTVRAYLSGQDFSRDGSLDAGTLAQLPASLQATLASGNPDAASYFLPQGNSTVGACLNAGDNRSGQPLQGGYSSRAWLPYAELCLRHNTVAGDGYSARLGVAGSVAGADQLLFQWLDSSGSLPGSSAQRALSIQYRHYF